MLKNIILCLLILLSCFTTNLFAQEATVPASALPTSTVEEKNGILSNVHFNFDAGARYSSWEPGYYKTYLEFETEASSAYDINADVSFWDYTFFSFKYERPFHKSAKQTNILEHNKTQKSGIEKYKFAILLESLIEILDIKNGFIKLLLSTKMRYHKERFFGDLIAKKDFDYVPGSATITRISSTRVSFSEFIHAAKGDKLAFQTDFEDYSITMGVILDDAKFFEFRFGLYKIEWTRPSDRDKRWTSDNGFRVIYDSTYKSTGLELSLQSHDKIRPGPGFNITGRLGFSNDIDSGVGDDFKEMTGKDLVFGSAFFDLWYTLYFNSNNKKVGALMTIGGSFDRKYFATHFAPFTGAEDNDNLLKGYLRFGYSF